MRAQVLVLQSSCVAFPRFPSVSAFLPVPLFLGNLPAWILSLSVSLPILEFDGFDRLVSVQRFGRVRCSSAFRSFPRHVSFQCVFLRLPWLEPVRCTSYTSFSTCAWSQLHRPKQVLAVVFGSTSNSRRRKEKLLFARGYLGSTLVSEPFRNRCREMMHPFGPWTDEDSTTFLMPRPCFCNTKTNAHVDGKMAKTRSTFRRNTSTIAVSSA